jgi:hypothetical protein
MHVKKPVNTDLRNYTSTTSSLGSGQELRRNASIAQHTGSKHNSKNGQRVLTVIAFSLLPCAWKWSPPGKAGSQGPGSGCKLMGVEGWGLGEDSAEMSVLSS